MTETLAQAIAREGSPVELLRNQNWPAFTFPVAPEFTNWRDEQRAWNTSVALMDQSHHMTQLFMDGADLIPLLQSISPNTFATFRPGVAKQLIAVNRDGYLIGDGILFYHAPAAEDPEGLVLIGHHILIDWVRFNIEKAQAAGEDVSARLEPNSHMRQGPPTFYRYELQGPRADEVMEKVFGGPAPDLKFFHIGSVEIAGRPVRALRHGMAGQPGFEFYGPWEDNETVLNALMEAGEEFGIRRVGAKAYSASPLESGWVPTPFPAIFDDDFAEYREWLPAARAGSIGGSLYSEDVHDYERHYAESINSHMSSSTAGYGANPFSDIPGSREPFPAWTAERQAPISTEEIEDIFLDLAQKFGFQKDNMRNMVRAVECHSAFFCTQIWHSSTS